MAEILVTGGTGTLGSQLVQQLCYQGLDVGIISTREHVDLPSGAKIYFGDLTKPSSIQNAVADASIVIHCASRPRDARTVDLQGTKNLLECIDRKRILHFIYVSIAGVDHSPYPYYRIKYEVEKIIQGSPIPWSVLRATQFHDLVLNRFIQPLDVGDGTPIRIPKEMRFQSIDVKEVALRLQQLAKSAPLRSTVTIGGPQILTIEEMTAIYLHVHGRDAAFFPEDIHGELEDVFRSGINIDPEWATGKITWENFLRNMLNVPIR